MLIKGIKKFLLVIGLVITSSLCFVGCNESKIKVKSVKFEESETITMVAEQTYTPKVNVAPSYANNTDYEFVLEADNGVIKIEGKSIIAIKEGVAQLKVVSDENENITDVIAIKVLRTAIQLPAPANLTFNGESFSFNAVDYATKYYININGGEDIALGNTTSYSLEEYKLLTKQSPYDKLLNVKVRAEGDDRITVKSNFSEVLSVTKISDPSDLVINNNILTFNKIKNVEKYSLRFSSANGVLKTLNISAEDYSDEQIKINISDYLNIFTGGQYFCSLTALAEDYIKVADEKVLSSNEIQISFDVLKSPGELIISNYTLYWDEVLGATSYNVYKNGSLFAENLSSTNLNLLAVNNGLVEGENRFKVVAISNKTVNVVSGLNYTDEINIGLLGKTSGISVSNSEKLISWTPVDNAVSYNLIIKNGAGKELVNINLASTSYSISSFTPSSYTIKITAQGDNKNYLTSLESVEGGFEILAKATNLKIVNRVASWESANTKFYLAVFKGAETTPIIEELNYGEKTFNLNDYTIEAGVNYTLKIKALAGENQLDSEIISTTFYKLTDVSKVTISNNKISLTIDGKSVTTQLKCEKGGVLVEDVLTASTKTSYTLNADSLGEGDYLLTASAYGNEGSIWNADNISANSTLEIKKLSSGGLKLENVVLGSEAKPYLKLINTSVYAKSYKVYDNGVLVSDFDADLGKDLSSLSVGEHEFTVEAIGNNTTVLNSVRSSVQVKALKLATPVLNFDNETLKFSVERKDAKDYANYIDNYQFSLTPAIEVYPKTITNLDAEIDCSAEIITAGSYTGEVYMVAKSGVDADGDGEADFDLILNSGTASKTITKINATSEVKLSGNQIYIVPTTITDTNRKNYTPIIKINGEIYTGAKYDSTLKGYAFKVYDENYNAQGPEHSAGGFIFATAGSFNFELQLTRSGYVASDFTSCVGTVTKLDIAPLNVEEGIKKVSTQADTNKAPTEFIKFSEVANATDYIIRIIKSAKTYEISANEGLKADEDPTKLTIDKLKSKFKTAGLTLSGGAEYEIDIIAVDNDESLTINSNVSNKFTIKLIKWPTITIVNDEIVVSDFTNGENVYLVLTDSEKNTFNKRLTKTNPKLSLSEITGLKEGEVSVKACFQSDDLNTFLSSYRTGSKYTQLSAPVLTVTNGVVTWPVDANAKEYVLTYNGTPHVLKAGVANFSISEETAYYDLKGLDFTSVNITVQSIGKGSVSGNYYYSSLPSATLQVSKLQSAEVSVVEGKIKIRLFDDLSKISKVVISNVEGERYDCTELSSEFSLNAYDLNGLFKYNSESEILEESFTVSVLANDDANAVLNAKDVTFTAKGLKPINNVSIATSYDIESADIEVIDLLKWEHNLLNTELVSKYYIMITFAGKTYTQYVSGNETSIAFPTLDKFDLDPAVDRTGQYKIKIRAITDTTGYVNSQFSEEFIVNVLSQPTKITTKDGILTWDAVTDATEYILSVEHDGTKENIKLDASITSFAFKDSYETGVYKIKLFATCENNDMVVASLYSEEITVVRLPEITSYKIEKGELYFNVHTYTTKIELTFRSKTGGEEKSFSMNIAGSVTPEGTGWNNSPESIEAIEADLATTKLWSESDPVGWKYIKFEDSSSGTATAIINLLNGKYDLQITAIGNTENLTGEQTTARYGLITSKTTISGDGVNNLKNSYVGDGTNNFAQKLVTPNIDISKRGVISFGLDATYNDITYVVVPGLIEVPGFVIYEVKLTINGAKHTFYGVDNYYEGCLSAYPASYVTVVDNTATADPYTFTGYIKCEAFGAYANLNILRTKESAEDDYTASPEIDFSKNKFYYLDKDGVEVEVDLTQGGNFTVSASIIGDDTVYLSSNTSSTKEIRRYRQLSLDIVDGTLRWSNIKTEGDDKIYLLKIERQEANSEDNYIIAVAYYNKELVIDDKNFPEVVGASEYYKASYDYSNDYFYHNLADTLGGVNIYSAGTYLISVTSYYIDRSDPSRLESLSATPGRYFKLDDISVSIQGGLISWNKLDETNEYAIILDGTTIKLEAGDYEVKSGVAYYHISEEYGATSGDHTITIMALGGDGYLNSNFSTEFNYTVSTAVEEIAMNNGRLEWAGSAGEKYQIKVEVLNSEEELLYTCYESNYITNNFYKLPKGLNSDQSMYVTFGSNYKYKIYIRRIGNDTNTLTGYYTTNGSSLERLKTVDVNSVYTYYGAVVWNKITDVSGVELEDVTYEITFSNGEILSLNVTEFDFAGTEYSAGEYKFTIRCLNGNYFDGYSTTEAIVYKLPAVGLISVSEGTASAMLQWSASKVQKSTGEEIYAENYRVYIEDATTEEVVYSELYTLSADEIGLDTVGFNLSDKNITVLNMRVKVRAVSTASKGHLINAEWSEYTAFTRPEPINSETFVVDRNKHQFIWEPISDEQGDEIYVLKFKYREKVESISSSEKFVSLKPEDKVNGKYVYQLTKIGLYEDISVTVKRESLDLSSDPVVLMEADKAISYLFNVFASGEGTESLPYIITTAQHFTNIKLFPDKHYKLEADIDLTGVNTIIADEFKGTLDGEYYLDNNGTSEKKIATIKSYSLTSSDNYIGLFRKLTGATIKNIILDEFNVSVDYHFATFKNYAGILAGMSENSYIENIKLINSIININTLDNYTNNSGYDNLRYFYYGGLFGYVKGGDILNSNINLGKSALNSTTYATLHFTGGETDKVYFGGVAGYAENTKYTGVGIDVSQETNQVYYKTLIYQHEEYGLPNVHFGGVFAEMNNTTVSGVKLEIVQSENYEGRLASNGGVVGRVSSFDLIDTKILENISVIGSLYYKLADQNYSSTEDSTKCLIANTKVSLSIDEASDNIAYNETDMIKEFKFAV